MPGVMRKTVLWLGTVLLVMVVYLVPGYTSCLVITKNGNIRSGPGTDFKIIGTVEEFDVFEGHVDGAHPKWFRSETSGLEKTGGGGRGEKQR